MLAMVKVFPLPVTPKSVWCLLPAAKEANSPWIAFGWSPAGWYLETSLNLDIKALGDWPAHNLSIPDLALHSQSSAKGSLAIKHPKSKSF